MKCLVTGAAGFIGSHLSEQLLRQGHDVVGVDAFIPYYPKGIKEANLATCRSLASFRLVNCDLRDGELTELFDGVEAVFHLAAMPGLPRSWTDFSLYESCNITATQRLITAATQCPTLKRFVYASTSSVYGRYGSGDEAMPTRPISPYGVTKFAAEQLCRAYADEFGLPLVVLRYFSVYGPRQRPDMGYHKFIHALLTDEPITVFGDGHQVRGNTYIDDCVAATIAAVHANIGEVYNIGGGETASVWDILQRLETITGRSPRIHRQAARPGDQRHTAADTTKSLRHLDWQPEVSLTDGLSRQVDWHRAMLSRLDNAA
jgi:nucleoside-diphosphate-sugar epimerase